MMKIKRREFLKAAFAAAGALGLEASGLIKLQEVLAANGLPPVIWLQGASCTGCSMSFLNSINLKSAKDILIEDIDLQYHPNLSAAAGDLAISAASVVTPSLNELQGLATDWLSTDGTSNFDLDGDGDVNLVDFAKLSKRGYILVVEGAIPTSEFCEIADGLTMIDALDMFSANASLIVCVGTCASFGGIPASGANPTGAMGVNDALVSLGKSPTAINISGCPVHPDWFVGTLVSALTGQAIPLDDDRRPTAYFGNTTHSGCEFNYQNSPKVRTLGEVGCLNPVGCKGELTKSDCGLRKWNSGGPGENGVNWCIGAGSPCIGCTEKGFPDGDFAPFYNLGTTGGGGGGG
jgi:hydrogenase small subunit